MISKSNKKKKYKEEIHKMCDEIIMQLALISTIIQTRETEMLEK